jgi:hypothetical protein
LTAIGCLASRSYWQKGWEREQPRRRSQVGVCLPPFGGLWSAEQFSPQWRAWAGRLGIRQTEEIIVLADGAKWIWKQVEQNLPGAAGVLDIYHANEHLYAAAKALYREGATKVPALEEELEDRKAIEPPKACTFQKP